MCVCHCGGVGWWCSLRPFGYHDFRVLVEDSRSSNINIITAAITNMVLIIRIIIVVVIIIMIIMTIMILIAIIITTKTQ